MFVSPQILKLKYLKYDAIWGWGLGEVMRVEASWMRLVPLKEKARELAQSLFFMWEYKK